ncbi:Uncharacterized protein dnm_011760 [Desulfonema magnum]|uniref:Uncharacterized protein n=1 Tax=Desulfonema magnum TaxID=45655 RepID=A0A975BGV3_9BACT|nr:Uncharacterized protein dnm_011760 [Desulfonema magnum]
MPASALKGKSGKINNNTKKVMNDISLILSSLLSDYQKNLNCQ